MTIKMQIPIPSGITKSKLIPFWLWCLSILVISISTSVSHEISFHEDYPRNVTIAETNKARFVCWLYKEHESTDQVSWMKHDKKLDKENRKYLFEQKQINKRIYEFSLVIFSVDKSDASDYRCIFDTSTHKIASRKAYLKVPSKECPKCYFTEPLYYIGDNAEITCTMKKTSTKFSMEFTRLAEIATSHENVTHMWITSLFPAKPGMNNTRFSYKLYINIIKEWHFCYTDPLIIVNKLNVTIHGDTIYMPNVEAEFTCVGNFTDAAKFTWTFE
ncbi:uncharacterized protein [Antedon mediterranea]|uniref:uncharacterized protein n=1 Tax=Antedon mediterranea TaxID=105859 RepID=UPI003AF49A5E